MNTTAHHGLGRPPAGEAAPARSERRFTLLIVGGIALAVSVAFVPMYSYCTCGPPPAKAERRRQGLGWDYTTGHPLQDCDLACVGVPYPDLQADADVLVVGAGLSGAILAHLHATLRDETVLVIERRNHIAGNMYDYVDGNGMRSSMYGPHYFHTNDERVWQFLNRFSQWHYYEYRVVANVTDVKGQNIYPAIPINIDTANAVFGLNIHTREEMVQWLNKTQDKYPGGPRNAEEAARERVGKVLYEKFFEGYTTKQWERPPRDLYPSVTQRIPVWSTHDDRYFSDAHQAKPVKGFTELIRPMLTHPKIRYLLNTDYFEFRKYHNVRKYKKVFYTGPIDQYFSDKGMPKLEYRSLSFDIRRAENVDPADGKHSGHPWARCDTESGRLYIGGRELKIEHRVSSPEACCALCSNTRKCRWWSLSAGVCVLYASKGHSKFSAGAVSGRRLGKTAQPATTLNQPSAAVPHTRSCEYKWLPWDHMTPGAEGLPHSSLFYEYPSSTGEPYYPIPNERNVALYKKYQQLALEEEKINSVHFVGRLANYKYFNMDQTAANALAVYERVYPSPQLVVPVNEQDLVVVTVLQPTRARYDERPGASGHWMGICRLAHSIAADDNILWLVVDHGNELGDPNVKDLLKDLGLPARSAYFYGNGAERGRALVFDYIRRNRISGTVYVADSDNVHHPRLWSALRRREPGRVGVLAVGEGGWAPAQRSGPGTGSWDVAYTAGVAFSASLLHVRDGDAPSFTDSAVGLDPVQLLPPADTRRETASTGRLPQRWQCLPDNECSGTLVATKVPASDPGFSTTCNGVPPGERRLIVKQL